MTTSIQLTFTTSKLINILVVVKQRYCLHSNQWQTRTRGTLNESHNRNFSSPFGLTLREYYRYKKWEMQLCDSYVGEVRYSAVALWHRLIRLVGNSSVWRLREREEGDEWEPQVYLNAASLIFVLMTPVSIHYLDWLWLIGLTDVTGGSAYWFCLSLRP